MKDTYTRVYAIPTEIYDAKKDEYVNVTLDELDNLMKKSLGKAYCVWKYWIDTEADANFKKGYVDECNMFSMDNLKELGITKRQLDYYKVVLKSKGLLANDYTWFRFYPEKSFLK